MMGEIDTKPIEPVQVALSLFGEKGDQRKSSSTSNNDLANYKVQLEAMDGACKQALLKLEHYQKRADEHFNLLRNTEIARDMFIDECREAKTQIRELDSKMKEMADQLLETNNIREQLAHVLSELKAAQKELLSMESEVAIARYSNLKAMAQAKLMETAADMEKERAEELLGRVSELSEAFVKSRLAAVEAEKEKVAVLSEKDAEIELATAAAVQAQMQLEDMRKQNEMVQLELKQSNELLGSSEKSASDAVNSLNQLRIDFDVHERKNLDQSVYIEALEMELNQLKVELNSSKEEVGRLKCVVETLKDELEKTEDEEKRDEADGHIKISLKEYESLIRKAEKADHIHVASGEDAGELTKVENNYELENLKKQLELAMVKVGEFRNRAEQAVSRAELAEKAKAAVEDHLRRSRQKQQRRKAAIAALREESAPKEFNAS
ncbi:uncharacterized protein LOC132176492 [Corylus avellana]|uniref:uncharacterized protein LOC132176492 n=1 Tax=Corylus avellana TaxID=13451 RepID=UPI00286B9A35|nr:uncharacterized protein LOC132176492 [Corylus avellana]